MKGHCFEHNSTVPYEFRWFMRPGGTHRLKIRILREITTGIFCMFSRKLLVKGYNWPIQSVINCLRNCFCNSSIVYEIV